MVAPFALKMVHTKDYALIALGTLLAAVALDCFLVPSQLAAGGATGLATIIYYLTLNVWGHPVPIGVQTIVMNVLLMVPVLREGGLHYASRTVVGIVALALFTDVLAPVLPVLAQDNILLATVCGGLLAGLGLGIAFRAGGNTGGTDIVAQLLARHTSLSVGTWMLVVDAAIVAASAPLFSVETALCAGLAVVVSSVVIDYASDGPSTERAAWIISSEYEKIADALMTELGRGCTLFSATGCFTKEKRDVLFVILSRNEVGDLKQLIGKLDPNAIVGICDMYETFGEGFKEMGV